MQPGDGLGGSEWVQTLRTRLRATGVPAWAPVGGSPDHRDVARYYAWVEHGHFESRLLLAPGVEERETIDDLLRICEQDNSVEHLSEPLKRDPSEPVALMIVRAGGGVGCGSLGRPDDDLVPLSTLREFTVDDLTTRRDELAGG